MRNVAVEKKEAVAFTTFGPIAVIALCQHMVHGISMQGVNVGGQTISVCIYKGNKIYESGKATCQDQKK